MAKVEGAREWTALGTDDSAPYRVFADLATLPGAALARRSSCGSWPRTRPDGWAPTARRSPWPPRRPWRSPGGPRSTDWLVVHYNRPAGDYDGWGLHVWGDVVDAPTWDAPLPFAGETGYGRFAWVKLKPGARSVGFIAHRGDEKDTDGDRFVDPGVTPQVWLGQGGRPCSAPRSRRPVRPSCTTRATRPGSRPGSAVSTRRSRWCRGSPPPRRSSSPWCAAGRPRSPAAQRRIVWVNGGKVFTSLAASENRAVIHYHRPDGDYTDWTLYHWTGSLEPSLRAGTSRGCRTVPTGSACTGRSRSHPVRPD